MLAGAEAALRGWGEIEKREYSKGLRQKLAVMAEFHKLPEGDEQTVREE